VSIRHQLRDTSIKVFEVIPPTVDTELEKEREMKEDRKIKAYLQQKLLRLLVYIYPV
jgi:short-subunit dehydrogenase involved in D-alanine esterification of teichoic acids